MSVIKYAPPKSVQEYIRSEKFVSLIVGPVGCVSGDTEFLTPTGWKRIDAYEQGDLVAQWGKDSHRAEFVVPDAYIKEPCETMLHFSHREGLSQVLSAEHRMVYKLRRKGEKLHEKTALEVAEWHWRNGADMVRVPVTFEAPRGQKLAMTDTEIRLAVAFAADGYLPPGGRKQVINIKKKTKKVRLESLLNDCGIDFKIHKSGEGYSRYYFDSPCTDKVFGVDWWAASPDQLQVIAHEAFRWDGGENKSGMQVYRTMHKSSADFIQYAFVTTGRKTSLNWTGRCWQVMASARGAESIGIAGRSEGGKSNNVKLVPTSDGFKYCFTVPTSYLILRHNDCVFVTGNSGKTTASIFKVLYHAARMRKQADGIRRSRCVVIRNTRGQLADTTIPSFQTWFGPDIATFMKTEMKMFLKIGDVECEILFRGMDDQQDIRKLLSLEVSFAFLDELGEIPQGIFDAVQGRVGRYPSKAKGGCVQDDGSPNHHVFGSSNPPDMDTFWEQHLTSPPDNASVHLQPSGLSPEADWCDNLIDGYYDNLAQGKTQDWIDVYIHSKFGRSLSGQPVFRSFDRQIHVAKTTLRHVIQGNSLLIGFDCGLTPAAVIAQVDYQGRLIVFESIISDGMGALRFAREKLKPVLAQRFPGVACTIIADPAGQQRAQTDERTVFDILRAEGFTVRAAKTNSIVARISAVDAYLTRVIDGKPAVLLDPAAQNLTIALAGKYRYKVKNNGEVEDSPEKTHPWSDIADAFEYVCLQADGGNTFGTNYKTAAKQVRQVNYVYS